MSTRLESLLDRQRREDCAKNDAALRAANEAQQARPQHTDAWHGENDRRARELQQRELDCGVLR